VRMVLEVEGERISSADIQIGYLHRCFEKESESATWTQVFPYTDRLNYISPMLNNVGYAMAVEKLTEIEVSTGTFFEPSAGWSARIAGAGPVVNDHRWSTEFTTPLGSLMPPASVNVYDVLGAKIARGWSRVNPVSPESQTIRQGASGPALKAASRSHE